MTKSAINKLLAARKEQLLLVRSASPEAAERAAREADRINGEIVLLEKKTHYPLSRQELQVAKLLNDKGLLYVKRFYIPKLDGDDRPCRYATFYLPRDDLYIEVHENDLWRQQQWFERKMAVYRHNGLRHINLFPADMKHAGEHIDEALHPRKPWWRTLLRIHEAA